jgi:hypothetical protein
MPWNPARLVLEDNTEALRQAIYRRSGVAIPEGLMGVLQSLDLLDVEKMIAGTHGGWRWLAIEKSVGLDLLSWTEENPATVHATSVPLTKVNTAAVTWDPEWVRRVQLQASQAELYNMNRAVDLSVSFSEPVGPLEVQRLAMTISGSMVLDNHYQAVDWILRLQSRLTGADED